MAVEFQFEIDHQNIMRVSLFGDWDEHQSQARVFTSVVNQAILYRAVAIFINNEVESTLNKINSLFISKALSPESGIKCIANYRVNIPEPSAIAPLSIQARISKDRGVPIRTFYEEAEAEEWLMNQIRGEVGKVF